MNRREALKSLGIAAGLPLSALSAGELLALSRFARARLLAQSLSDGRFVFRSLDPEQEEILASACELILPETDTPGARTARVHEFIDVILTDWFTVEERRRFLRGLRDMEERARRSWGRGFVSGEEEQQTSLLQELEDEALEALPLVAPTRRAVRPSRSTPEGPFFTVLKWLTLFGYFTSEPAMERELEHVVFPGTYDGCAPRNVR